MLLFVMVNYRYYWMFIIKLIIFSIPAAVGKQDICMVQNVTLPIIAGMSPNVGAFKNPLI